MGHLSTQPVADGARGTQNSELHRRPESEARTTVLGNTALQLSGTLSDAGEGEKQEEEQGPSERVPELLFFEV